MSDEADKAVRGEEGRFSVAAPSEPEMRRVVQIMADAPRIERPRFQSPMVNIRNKEISESSHRDREVCERVAARLKPMAVQHATRSTMEEMCRTVVRSGGAASVCLGYDPGTDHRLFMVAVDGVIDQTFDLDALRDDYDDYLSDAPGDLRKEIREELDRLAPMRFADLLDWYDVEVEFLRPRVVSFEVWLKEQPVPAWPVRCPGSLARCGLLLGYPIETTDALIRQDQGLKPGSYVASWR